LEGSIGAAVYTQVSSKKKSPPNLEKRAMLKKKIETGCLKNGHINQK
jgi:hypothetical protein